MNPTEHQIQNAIIGYLKYKGWYVQRMNSGAVRVTNKYGNQHMMRMSAAGTPDLMAFKDGNCDSGDNHFDCKHTELLFVEVKRPSKKATALQAEKMKELEEYGARCLVATSIDDLEAAGL